MRIKCLICEDIIESKYRHGLVSCKCENCYIDGSNDYCYFGGKDFNKVDSTQNFPTCILYTKKLKKLN